MKNATKVSWIVLIVSVLLGLGGVFMTVVSRVAHQVRIETALTEVGNAIFQRRLFDEEHGVRELRDSLSITSADFAHILVGDQKIGSVIVLSPVTPRGDRIQIGPFNKNRIIAWTRDRERNDKRAVLTADFGVYWIDDSNIEWDNQYIRELDKAE